ncbi:MAG: 3'-5' exoribonuclease [Chitinophagales bacterium]|nr:3'-5' exoribonuclease [Chitinophagales bacterium]
MATILFLDTEFTGLHQHASLISLALYENEESFFYAEFNDYDESLLNPWLIENVVPKLEFRAEKSIVTQQGNRVHMKGSKSDVANAITAWIKQYKLAEIWADVLAYDWVLFCELFGGAFGIPENIFYTPFDLATLFRTKGMTEPVSKYGRDVKRFELAGIHASLQHHALWDARAEYACYHKIINHK